MREIDLKNRHPVDSRMLIIHSMDDFEIWRERSMLREQNIHGLMYQYPASQELLQECAAIIAKHIQNKWVYRPNSGMTRVDQIELPPYAPEAAPLFQRGRQAFNDMFKTALKQCHLGFATDKILADIFDAADMAQLRTPPTLVRLDGESMRLFKNRSFPSEYHNHINKNALNEDDNILEESDSVLFSFNKDGTLAHSGIKEGKRTDIDGAEYRFPAGCIAIIDKTIPHMADEPDESWEDEPRISLLI